VQRAPPLATARRQRRLAAPAPTECRSVAPTAARNALYRAAWQCRHHHAVRASDSRAVSPRTARGHFRAGSREASLAFAASNVGLALLSCLTATPSTRSDALVESTDTQSSLLLTVDRCRRFRRRWSYQSGTDSGRNRTTTLRVWRRPAEAKASTFGRQVHPVHRRQLPTGLRERSGHRVLRIRRSIVTPAWYPQTTGTDLDRLPWGSAPYDACRSRQRPTPGLPPPAALRLQVFSTS
jgi:hypothetical protein